MADACQKIAYGTRKTAKRKLRRLKARRRHQHADKIEDHAYRCPDCGKYHLTSQPRRW